MNSGPPAERPSTLIVTSVPLIETFEVFWMCAGSETNATVGVASGWKPLLNVPDVPPIAEQAAAAGQRSEAAQPDAGCPG